MLQKIMRMMMKRTNFYKVVMVTTVQEFSIRNLRRLYYAERQARFITTLHCLERQAHFIPQNTGVPPVVVIFQPAAVGLPHQINFN